MIYYWSFEECTFKKVERDLGLQEHSFVDWRNYLREVCALQMMSLEMQLGGEGIEVQIDESLFVRRKYDRGRLLREQWIFGAIDCSTKESICIPVENRKKETLIPLILKYIKKGSIIVSDAWASYLTISLYGYEHYIVNHSENFVDPLSGKHTQRIENLWMLAKRRNKKESGTRRDLIDSYMFEFMWRCKYGNDPFKNIIEHINKFY